MLHLYKITFSLIFFLTFSSYADMSIIKNGNIVAQKLYSKSESTLIVNNSQRIYVCSVDKKNSKCILSNINNEENF